MQAPRSLLRVRTPGGEYKTVRIGPGATSLDVILAVVGAVDLPHGSFVLKNDAGGTTTIDAELTGDWTAASLPDPAVTTTAPLIAMPVRPTAPAVLAGGSASAALAAQASLRVAYKIEDGATQLLRRLVGGGDASSASLSGVGGSISSALAGHPKASAAVGATFSASSLDAWGSVLPAAAAAGPDSGSDPAARPAPAAVSADSATSAVPHDVFGPDLVLHNDSVAPPTGAAAMSAAAPTIDPAVRARQRWAGILHTPADLRGIEQQAKDVASRILSDLQVTLLDEESKWGTPVRAVLRRPLPVDTSCSTKHCVFLEGMEPTDCDGVITLRRRVWDFLRLAMLSTSQRAALLLLLGVSGAGKTKVAFDIGREFALLIFARVYEKGVKGSLTRPWELLVTVLRALQTQLQQASRMNAGSGPAQRGGSGAPAAVQPESTAAVASIIVLLACHVEWVAMVCAAAARELSLKCTGGGATAVTIDMDTAIREVAVRAQRNGTAFDNVHDLFCLRLQRLLETGGLHRSGRVSLSISVAMRALACAEVLLPRSRGSQSASVPLPAFVCIDELGALIDSEHSALDGLFRGTFEAEAETSGASQSPQETPLRYVPPAESRVGPNRFPALPEDLSATRSRAQGRPAEGLLYGVLVALRHVMSKHAWGVLLCGTNLRLDAALLSAHSPAQGVSMCMDADTVLDAHAIRSWLGDYLTADAMAGVDDSLLCRLVGRPLYASFFWAQVQGGLSPSGARDTRPFCAAAFVREALERAVEAAGNEADVRISALWSSSFQIRHLDSRPNLLLAWLYFLRRMGWGSQASLAPPSCSSEVMDAVSRGVLHIRRDQRVFNLADEPITMESIMRVGDRETAECSSLSDDMVLRAIARRVTGVFGDASAKGNAAEDVIAWVLLRSSLFDSISLRDLLDPFLSPLARELFPPSLAGLSVRLTSGLHCAAALGNTSAYRCFLELLEKPGGENLLLHHTQETSAGADFAFLAMGPPLRGGTRPVKLVLLQIRNRGSGTLADALPSVNLGNWYPDIATRAGETRSHAALRRLMERNSSWASPVRVVCTARQVADSAVLDVAWVNAALVPQQPLLVLHFSTENTGVDILQWQATSFMHSPSVKHTERFLPTQLRHWAPRHVHPQQYLPSPPPTSDGLQFPTPSHVVSFWAEGNQSAVELLLLAHNYGSCRVLEAPSPTMAALRSTRSKVTATANCRLTVSYDRYASAITAASAAHLGFISIGDYGNHRVLAAFLPETPGEVDSGDPCRRRGADARDTGYARADGIIASALVASAAPALTRVLPEQPAVAAAASWPTRGAGTGGGWQPLRSSPATHWADPSRCWPPPPPPPAARESRRDEESADSHQLNRLVDFPRALAAPLTLAAYLRSPGLSGGHWPTDPFDASVHALQPAPLYSRELQRHTSKPDLLRQRLWSPQLAVPVQPATATVEIRPVLPVSVLLKAGATRRSQCTDNPRLLSGAPLQVRAHFEKDEVERCATPTDAGLAGYGAGSVSNRSGTGVGAIGGGCRGHFALSSNYASDRALLFPGEGMRGVLNTSSVKSISAHGEGGWAGGESAGFSGSSQPSVNRIASVAENFEAPSQPPGGVFGWADLR